MESSKKYFTIVLTGGGTAGHVIPHLALLPLIREKFSKIVYIGSHNGIEKEIIEKYNRENSGAKGGLVKYYSIDCAKLRRSFDLRNLLIPFKVWGGIRQSKKILREVKPNVIFSKGGFVAYPVVNAGAKLGIPVVAHESDMTLGLANRLSSKHCRVICTSFDRTANENNIKNKKDDKKGEWEDKFVYTGSPLREVLFNGIGVKVERRHGFSQVGVDSSKKTNLLVVGGSLGAVKINNAVRESLGELTKRFNIIHICGKDKTVENTEVLKYKSNYIQLEFVDDIQHYFAWADLVVSRAGSNALCELMALQKPTLLIPLSKAQSRGDQIDNAKEMLVKQVVEVLWEEELTSQTLIAKLEELHKNRERYIVNIKKMGNVNGTKRIFEVIKKHLT